MPPFPVAETNGTISLYKNLAYLLRFVKRFLLFSNHNLTILRKTRNSVLDKVSHSILSQPIHIVFFLYLLQCFGTCSIHISIFCIFEFDYNSLIFFIKRFLISLFGIVRRYFPLSVRPWCVRYPVVKSTLHRFSMLLSSSSYVSSNEISFLVWTSALSINLRTGFYNNG